MEIVSVIGREILDSRGNPTVEAEVVLADGSVGRGAAPSGASTGEYEAVELRDGDIVRYHGKGVTKAVENINKKLAPQLVGKDSSDIYAIDKLMLEIDDTADKSNIGANAILAVSIANLRASAASARMPVYMMLGGLNAATMPVPMMNIINGGAHASNSLEIQEFMIVPTGADNYKEAVRMCTEIFHVLKGILKTRGYSTGVGDEGGFAPDLKEDEDAITLILEAVREAGYEPGMDICIAIDAAASEWKGSKRGEYRQPKKGSIYTTKELIEYWSGLVDRYPIISIEDPLDENDFEGWEAITKALGEKVQLVGDDLFVTNVARLRIGIEQKLANSILIKPNQIGTITETMETVRLATKNGYNVILSHRSGETSDSVIADLAVALNCGQIKAGAPSRGERVEKYNQLLRIEDELYGDVKYYGKSAFL